MVICMENKAEQILTEVNKVISGKDEVTKKVLTAFLSRGHVLLEDVPGVGKTTMALAFAKSMGLMEKRIQFTPDTMPSDIVGFSVYDSNGKKLRYVEGAAMTNLLLADEINRTSSRTQAALLEVMEEGRITLDGESREVPKPFLVIATQNPAGSAGTQMLPAAQLDRFVMRLSMGYPDFEHQISMMKDRHHENPLDQVKTVVSKEELLTMQQQVDEIYISNAIYEYVTRLSLATREHELLRLGISPRAMLSICRLAKASAYLAGREYVITEDVTGIFAEACIHRVLVNTKGRMAETEKEEILKEILLQVKRPDVAEVK